MELGGNRGNLRAGQNIGQKRNRQVGSRHEERLGGERAIVAETCGGTL